MKTNRITSKFTLLLASLVLVLGLLAVSASMPSGKVWAATAKQVKAQSTKIIKAQVKTKDTDKAKMKKLFKYAEKTWGYKRVIGFANKKGWDRDYAYEVMTQKAGSCYHFAAGYGYLVKYATNYPVRIAIGKTNGFNPQNVQPHSWTEVKIGSKWYVCDANLDKFGAKSTLKYYLIERSKLKSTYNKYKSVVYVTL